MAEMTEKVQDAFNELNDVPKELRPFILGLIETRIGAHKEKVHAGEVSETWQKVQRFQEEELEIGNTKDVFERAVFLVTLPNHENEEIEWYYRWLRGSGWVILAKERMEEHLIELLDDPNKGRKLASSLEEVLDTNISRVKRKEELSDLPEAFTLFISFLVCRNFYKDGRDMGEARTILFIQSIQKLIEPETIRVMEYFGKIKDTQDLYKEYKPWRERFTY